MTLSQLAGVGNSLSSFLSIVRILSSQAILFQILLYKLFPRFSWSTLLPFSCYFKLHNLTYLGIDVSTHDVTIIPETALNYHFVDLHITHPTTLIPHIILIIRYSTPLNLASPTTVKFLRFTTVKQNWSNTALINLPQGPAFEIQISL